MIKKSLGVLAFIGAVGPAWSLVSFTGTNGSNLTANATFDVLGNQLIVVLSNVSTYDVQNPAEVLTGVYFDYNGLALPLGSTSAVLTTGSSVLFGTTDPGNVVGGEWAYGSGLSGAPHSAKNGISSSGLGIFGGATFPGTNLEGPAALDGVQYGITSAGDNPALGNAAVTGGNALIKSSVTFTLTGLPNGFNLLAISNVSFQYGTALTEPNITGGKDPSGEPSVPGPAAAVPFGIGFIAALRKRRS